MIITSKRFALLSLAVTMSASVGCGGDGLDRSLVDSTVFDLARDACLQAYPGTDEFIPVTACSSGPPGSPPTDCSDLDAGEQAITSCVADDGECPERQAIISSEAAQCVAAEAGLPPSIFSTRTDLVYDTQLRRVVWVVYSQTAGASDWGCGSRFATQRLDAVTATPQHDEMHFVAIDC